MNTMLSSEAYDIIERIAADSKKNGKQAIVNQHIGDPMFLSVVRYACDPAIVFGVATRKLAGIAASGRQGSPDFDASTWFLPRMVEAGYRNDKTIGDDLQGIKDQFEAAVEAV